MSWSHRIRNSQKKKIIDVESQVIGQIAVERRALSNGVEKISYFLVV